jgi:hypothetical protein
LYDVYLANVGTPKLDKIELAGYQDYKEFTQVKRIG